MFVFWDTIGQILATLAFFMAQVGLFTRYAVDADEASPGE
jgi:hypothetical protein